MAEDASEADICARGNFLSARRDSAFPDQIAHRFDDTTAAGSAAKAAPILFFLGLGILASQPSSQSGEIKATGV
jgi:hypothetical protein